jgi:hypothetical protein
MDPTRSTSIVIVENDAALLGALVFALEADGFTVHAHDQAAPQVRVRSENRDPVFG